jgi:hypothetical protein
MDREQFDAITRTFATKRSRRLAIAALAGAVLFHHESVGGLAKHKRRKHKDHRNRSTAGLCTPLENVCVPLGYPCCANTECVKPIPTTKIPLPGTCQSRSCTSDAECAGRFPGQDVYCEKDSFKCAGLRGSCCLPKPCDRNTPCPLSGLCAYSQCCAPGQEWSLTGCFGPISK